MQDNQDVIYPLIRAVFECKENQFNSNHSAISFLLKEKKASAVITTNFDNAIELCNNNIRPLIHPHQPNNLENEPYILKLHGDVIGGKIKATSPALIIGRKTDEYGYIKNLLNNKVVFVVGYSGYGDIDISPHLRKINKTCAKLIWVVEKNKKPPDFTKYWIRTNLKSEDKKDNWLLRLAAEYGWKGSTNSQNPEWEKSFKDWFRNISLENLRNSTYIMFDKGPGVIAGWPSLHMQYVRKLSYNTKNLPTALYWDLANAFSSVSAYRSELSELKYLDKFNVGNNVNNESLNITRLKGFTYWRLGELDNAMNILEPMVINPPQNNPQLDQRQLAVITRHYLEIARDIIRSKTSDCKHLKSKYLEKNDNLGKALKNFSSLKSEDYSFEDGLLRELIILDINRLRGEEIGFQKIQDVYNEACNCQSWNAADAAARLLISVNYFQGIKALKHVNSIYRELFHTKRRRKGIATRLYKIFRCPYILDLLDGFKGAKYGIRFHELTCKRRLRKWERFYKEEKIICE